MMLRTEQPKMIALSEFTPTGFPDCETHLTFELYEICLGAYVS